MRNILAIAQKEIRSYFVSPIAYIVIGMFALLYGWFYSVMLQFFVRQGINMSMMGGQQVLNINQDMLRPVLQNVTVLLLFVLPALTMRTYSEERRSGTIELLLTSPVSDFQIIMGKFIGALTLYAVMLSVTFIHVGLLFVYSNPEWKPIATSYLGLLLLGGSFLSIGLFISTLTTNQIVAYISTFSVFLFLWVINWIGSFSSGWIADLTGYLSVIDHFDDFSKGVIDTTHLIYYLSLITFGLFLTMKSVDTERWRG
ncbi:MAG: ABC transporter permease [Acidobacteriaceae bacterium]|jgi:ABC-2 type transport system permease protein|nr:ABC transporter permease [Acidobacteriaceae bacterium]